MRAHQVINKSSNYTDQTDNAEDPFEFFHCVQKLNKELTINKFTECKYNSNNIIIINYVNNFTE